MNVEVKEVNTKVYEYKNAFGEVVYESLLSPEEIQECKFEYREMMTLAAYKDAEYFKNHLNKAESYYKNKVVNEITKIMQQMLQYYIEDGFNETLSSFNPEDVNVEEYIGMGGDFKEVIVEEFFKEVFERAVSYLRNGLLTNGVYRYQFSKKFSEEITQNMIKK